ncbi:MAG: hypothetical protein MN733_30685 [Nitrososphaera sp.]|nr:hypothetical protein [Nitrososphaera sp.]
MIHSLSAVDGLIGFLNAHLGQREYAVGYRVKEAGEDDERPMVWWQQRDTTVIMNNPPHAPREFWD